MNFILSIIKFIKFKPIRKFKTFQRHNYDSFVISVRNKLTETFFTTPTLYVRRTLLN